jgi:Family of unknown function (DUF5683)
MAARRIFFLIGWLLCIPTTNVLAVTPKLKQVENHPVVQRSNGVVVPLATPQIAGNTPHTAAQDNAKNHRYIAEEMAMQRAWMYSAVLPGWGQVCNKHYGKVPVIYLGFVGLGWGAIYYHREYTYYKARLIQKKEADNLTNYVNDCRMGRDLCVILAALWYIANIFDAYVGSSLKTFTLSDDISMDVRPSVLSTAQHEPKVGLSMTLSFSK